MRVALSEPAGTIAPDTPTPSSSRVWNALTALPRLFFRREFREALSLSGNHVFGEERVGVSKVRRENPRNDVAQSRKDLNIPVDNVPATHAPGLHFGSTCTPTGECDVTPENWEGIVRRALFQTSREGAERPTVVSRSEATLSHLSIRYDREPHTEASAHEARNAYETGSSSSDSDDDREISGAGTAFCGIHGENNRDARRSEAARPVNAVKALKDWRISFSGSSSTDAKEFLERLAEMQRYYRLRDMEILEAIPCVLTDHALQWFRSVAREARTLRKFEKRIE